MVARQRITLLRLLIIMLAVVGGIFAQHAQATGRFCTSAATLSFGNRFVGTNSSMTATIGNCGDQPWAFTDVSIDPATGAAFHLNTSCVTGMTLAPGGSCDAAVIFAPIVTGQTSGGLWLRNTTADSEQLLTFYGRGVDAQAGTATLAFVPAFAVFGSVLVGAQSSPLTVELHNQGPATMMLSAIVLNGPQVYDFSGLEDTCQVGTSIPAGQTCQMSLFFLPQATGTRLANLVIDSPQFAALAILQLSGTGTTSPPATARVIEYYDAAFDHYFITPLANEIALCDARQPPCQGWVRTGRTFNGFANTGAPALSVGVCRFFNDSFAPRSSHFYALHGRGCEQTITQFPDWQLESSDLFNMYVPDSSGNCPAGSIPVYRLYNNGMGAAPNHRFTNDLNVRAQMIAAGWLPEGDGIGVTFCSPQ